MQMDLMGEKDCMDKNNYWKRQFGNPMQNKYYMRPLLMIAAAIFCAIILLLFACQMWIWNNEMEEMKKEIAAVKKIFEELQMAKNEGNGTSVEQTVTEKVGEMEIIEMNSNKWNEEDRSPKLAISEDGIEVKHIGPNLEFYSIRTILSFNLEKSNKIAYYEMEILDKFGLTHIVMGFCDAQFPLEEKWLGAKENSIGLVSKGIWINGTLEEMYIVEENFKKGDVLGIGIIQQTNSFLECFATYNGKLMGKVALPQKFANVQLFPAASIFFPGDSFRANFDKDKWQFKEFESVFDLSI